MMSKLAPTPSSHQEGPGQRERGTLRLPLQGSRQMFRNEARKVNVDPPGPTRTRAVMPLPGPVRLGPLGSCPAPGPDPGSAASSHRMLRCLLRPPPFKHNRTGSSPARVGTHYQAGMA